MRFNIEVKKDMMESGYKETMKPEVTDEIASNC